MMFSQASGPVGHSSTDSINLHRGWPHPSLLLPARSLQQASGDVFSNPDIYSAALEYCPGAGYFPLREQLSQWLTKFYEPADQITPDRICITGGASQNLACILQTFTDPLYTRNVWMVAPTYFLACRIFDESGFGGKLRSVPEDEEGVDIDFLSENIQRSEEKAQVERNVVPTLKQPRPWRKIYKHIIYAVPTFANPSGLLMSLNRREALVRLARNFDALIITDDVYDALHWPSLPGLDLQYSDKACLPRMVDLDRYLDGGPLDAYGNAVSNASFSKIVGPGCRTGWAEATEQFAHGLTQNGPTYSGGCPSQLVASFLHQVLAASALQQHISQVLQPAYARRYHSMMSAIQSKLLPLGVKVPQAGKSVAGGYFIWLTLPEPLNADHIAKRALNEEDLIVGQGSLFKVQGDETPQVRSFDRDLRLCYSWEEEELLVQGVERLTKVIKKELAGE